MARQGTDSRILIPRIFFIVVALALTLLGLVMAYSASMITGLTSGDATTSSFLLSQLRYVGIGIVLVIALYFFPFEKWKGAWTYGIWGLCIVLIIATALFGVDHYGAKRWLVLPLIGEIQPSEFCKIGFALIACKLFADYDDGCYDIKRLAIMMVVLVLLPLAAIYVFQSDLGTTVICGLSIICAAWYSGKNKAIIIAIVIVCALLVVASIFLTSYRSDRLVYLDPWNDGENGFGDGYQTIHSLYALADGGFFGVGLGNSREKFLYLPARNTDYVFSVVCEELGMLGGIVIVLLFALLLYFGLRIAANCKSSFAATLAASLSTMLVFQAFLNIGCAIALFPMTGKPLPFFSTGGSSMLSTMIIIGFILAASRDSGMSSPRDQYEEQRSNLRVVRPVEGGARRSPRRG